MKLVLRLSGESFELSRAEVLALFGSKGKKLKKPNHLALDTTLSKSEVRRLCIRSAMIKKAIADGGEIYKVESGRFKDREPGKKRAFHPTLLKPKLARTLVNLSEVKPGEKLLDPMCGSGTILHEAFLLGIKAFGSDLDSRAIKRCRTNLEQYCIKARIARVDATKLEEAYSIKFDGIATDLPYGRSSTLAGRKIGKLYTDFLKSAAKVLKPKKKLVMVHPKGKRFTIPRAFKKHSSGELYVHGGLTRRVLVLEKV